MVASARKTLKPRAFTTRGFTLIEILVVIVILSLMISIATVSTGDSFQRKMRSEAERLQSVMMAAADEAIYNASELGFYLAEDSYIPLRYDQVAGGWVVMEQRPFTVHKLPEGMKLDWRIEGFARPSDGDDGQFVEIDFLVDDDKKNEAEGFDQRLSDIDDDTSAAAADGSLAQAVSREVLDITPQIYVLSSGEQTAFSASFARDFESSVDNVVTLVSDGFAAPYIKTESSEDDDA